MLNDILAKKVSRNLQNVPTRILCITIMLLLHEADVDGLCKKGLTWVRVSCRDSTQQIRQQEERVGHYIAEEAAVSSDRFFGISNEQHFSQFSV